MPLHVRLPIAVAIEAGWELIENSPMVIDRYRTAIQQNWRYKRNNTLNRNSIRILSSPKTGNKAAWFLWKTVGRPAKGHLQWCAKHDKNPHVRSRCKTLAKKIR